LLSTLHIFQIHEAHHYKSVHPSGRADATSAPSA